ncbi:MAG: FAD-dependent oxidoreductase, partial [Ignavibacteriae bacterium]|nr:FAD-dependent oxidoreductase [Ignavibacteriota bacterium]
VQRYIDSTGYVRNEGDVQVGGFPPYPISYRSIIPKKEECGNLLVPVCLSSSHIAFGSIRMEPVFMILAESATFAASLAISYVQEVQNVNYSTLRTELVKANQVLQWNY